LRVTSRGLGDVYKRQSLAWFATNAIEVAHDWPPDFPK
jgi:hypothetical protein